MKSFYFRIPALLCGGICFVAFLGIIQGGAKWSQVVFLAFLPTCFLLIGSLMLRMKHEMSRLRRRVAALEQQERPAPHTNGQNHILP